MYLFLRILTSITLVLFLTSNSYALTAEKDLEKKLNSFNTFKANFSEVVRSGKGKRLQQSRGILYIKRPQRFRWLRTSPQKQIIVGDGKNLWTYDVALKQVVVRDQPDGKANIPALILSGYNKSITRSYRINRSGNSIVLNSKRKGAIFRRLRLWFKNGRLYRLNLFDHLGQTTQIVFSNVRHNPKLSSKLFRFSPPKGVDVIKP